MSSRLDIKPQEGPQTQFLETTADIAFYGGSAGGGKSFGLLLDPLRHWENPLFGGVIFRRNTTQVKNEGGLWDESNLLYGPLGAHPREHTLEWLFPAGGRMKFAHLEHERTVLDWQGAQIAFIGFDEVTHFTETQFWYMLSRNRSTSGIRPYVRGTCNPDSDSWVRKLIDWWIGSDGLPIKERSGVLRFFARAGDTILWANSPEELLKKGYDNTDISSFTFIPAKLTDNKILMEKDPRYQANLKALNRVDRARLLDGNWNIRPSAGMYFRRADCEVIDAIPAGATLISRYWDRAATMPSEQNKDPDWTVGLLMHKLPNGQFVVADIRRHQESPLKVEQMIKNTAAFDSHAITIYLEQDPGSSGVADAQNYVRLLAGYDVRLTRPTQDKETRARPVSAQWEAGNIKVLRAPWNDEFFKELENFPEGAHDDQVDALSGAFNEMCGPLSVFDFL